MGIRISIDIACAAPVDVVAVVEYFRLNGWSINDHGKIVCLPPNDDGMYNWSGYDLSKWAEVKAMLATKVAANEAVGIVLIDRELKSGGEVLFWPQYQTISFMLSAGFGASKCSTDDFRQRIIDSLTDFGAVVIAVTEDAY